MGISEKNNAFIKALQINLPPHRIPVFRFKKKAKFVASDYANSC